MVITNREIETIKKKPNETIAKNTHTHTHKITTLTNTLHGILSKLNIAEENKIELENRAVAILLRKTQRKEKY